MSELKITIEPDSPDAKRIAAVAKAAQKGLNPKVALGLQPVSKLAPASYPFSTNTQWLSEDPVALPYGTAPAGPPSLRLWTFPNNLINLPGPRPYQNLPRLSAQVGTYNQATGRMDKAPVQYYGWGTLIGVGIKRTPPAPGSPSTACSYQLEGAGENDIVLLERLLTALAAPPSPKFIAALTLLYPTSTSGNNDHGLQSIGLSRTQMCITKVNLTTDTRPPSLLMAAEADGVYRTPGCFNTPDEFIRLLWECSITRSGGYYLYYCDTTSHTGFPEGIFNSSGEGQLTLLVTYYNPGSNQVSLQNRIGGYMNCAVSGDFIDPSSSVTFAEAAPLQVSVSPGQQSLAGVADLYYMDPLQLAADNALQPLAPGKPVTVSDGVYEVGTAPPGALLADIAVYFALQPQQIKNANPQIDWSQYDPPPPTPPAPLPIYTAVLLPLLTVNVGTSPGGSTLGAIAAYYGAPLAQVAADNQTVPGLFAAAAVLQVSGGPTVRNATVPPGVLPIEATRPVPADVPPDPTDPNYGSLYLEHVYNLLGYSVAKNPWFTASNLGLPMGPADTAEGAAAADRRRLPPPKQPGDDWSYRQAVPYFNFAASIQPHVGMLPDPAQSPYRGLGELVQVNFGWQDLFGNLLVTSLSNPALFPNSTLNQPPWRTGYTDPLVALSQWPGVSSSYRVYTNKDGPVTGPLLELTLSFDPTQFNPPPTDPQPLADGDLPGWQKAAQQALLTYQRLFYQLTQPDPATGKGYALTLKVTASILADPDVELTPDQLQSLQNWLFLVDDKQNSIYTFLQARAAGNSGAPAPTQLTLPVALPLAVGSAAPGAHPVNQAQLFELSAALVIARPQQYVDAAFQDAPGFTVAGTTVPPNATAAAGQALSLVQFAADLESALLDGQSLVKVAAGVDRREVAQSQVASPLWVVRFGLQAGGGITYNIPQPKNPALYAPRPIYNTLQTRTSVPIYEYTTGTGIAKDPSYYQDFSGVDADAWARQFVDAVDGFLSPELVTPARIVGHHDNDADYIAPLLQLKEQLAQTIAQLVIPVLKGEVVSDPAQQAATEAFRQDLLIRLGNAYSTNAVIQFKANVEANLDDPDADAPPRLYGGLVQNPVAPDASLTSPKLTLQTTTKDDPALLTFLLGTKSGTDGAESNPLARFVMLNLTYQPTNIEHQIGSLPDIKGYQASSWLSFIIPLDGKLYPQFLPALGPFPVPLVLRAFPTPPSLLTQAGTAATQELNPDLQQATLWDYRFVYGENYHYGQDYTYFTVIFNQRDPALLANLAADPDPVPALAQFITVYPAVQKDLDTVLSKIDATTTDAKAFTNARVAIQAFTDLVSRVSGAWSGYTALLRRQLKQARQLAADPNPVYNFYITEQAVQVAGQDALMVWIHGPAPLGITPAIEIDTYTTMPYQVSEGYGYVFRAADGTTYLDPTTGAALQSRTVCLPDLNILTLQDAWSSAYIVRNQYLMPDPTVETAPPFQYQTPQMKFGNPLHPTLDWDTALQIQTIGTPQTRPLAEHLSALLAALFADDPLPTQTIQMEIRYEFQVNPTLAAQSLPIYLVPPTVLRLPDDCRIPTGGCPLDGSGPFVCQLAHAITRWFQQNQPSANAGMLLFDLTVWSDLTPQPSPLLRLRQLDLDLQYIDPPLPTS